MNKRNRRMVRIIAIVLVALLVGGVIVSALLSALAEESPLPRDRYEIEMSYDEANQALQVEQRLVYSNCTGERLDRVVFNAAANLFRRESALMYESDDLVAVFPAGFAPGGMQLQSVLVDGVEADYGFRDENELQLRVACDLAPEASATFLFRYGLLLPTGGAFLGAGDEDVRLCDFALVPGVYDAQYREFILNKPLPFTRWLYADAADWRVQLTLPERYDLAAAGRVKRKDVADGKAVWEIEAEDVRAFALCFGKRWRRASLSTASGVAVEVLSSARDAGRVARIAAGAVAQCEAWFGDFPVDTLTFTQSDDPLGTLNYPGCVLLPSRLFERASAEELKRRIRFCVAQQYFGLAAYAEPSADAWLSDSLCAYLSYWMLEAEEGRDAFLKAVNRDWVSALQLTIPGGLTVTSDAGLFDGEKYDIVVRRRGAVVFHELRQAMGDEPMLAGLRAFYALGRAGGTLTEMDLVHCLDGASGRSWEAFLTDWAFHVGDYVNQTIDWFE